MKKLWKGILFVLFAAGFVFGRGGDVCAAESIVQVSNNNTTNVTVYVGDTGHIESMAGAYTDQYGLPSVISRWGYNSFDETIVSVDGAGNFKANSYGKTTVVVYGYSALGEILFTGYCQFQVYMDMTNVTLETDKVKGALTAGYTYTARIKINSDNQIDKTNSKISCSVDNANMSVSCELLENEIQITTQTPGEAKLLVVINGKVFEVSYSISLIEISKRSYVGSRGRTVKLRVKGTKEKTVWTSSDTKVVKVLQDGTIRCLKTGNAVVTAAIGEYKVGCAVSVVSAKLRKVIKNAVKIGTNWKYSQPKRMQNGYYDCSSLVWKSYKKMGKTFGMKNYAPVAADQAKWCAKYGKRITRSYTRRHIQKMKLIPGDLMFEAGQNNGRYMGIYHVEMFVGYAVAFYDSSGQPVLNELWGARPEGNYGGGYMIMRPYK